MTEGLVLDPSATLVELLVRELDQMERILDLNRVGQHRVEHRPIRTPQIQRRVRDVRPPLVAAFGEPPGRLHTTATRDNIEQLPGTHIHDRRRPRLVMARTNPHEQRLVEPQRSGCTDPVGIIDERFAIGDHRVVDRVPRAAELGSDLVDRASMTTTCSVTHRPARSVITNRDAPIAGTSSVHDPFRHDGSGHDQRRLRHTNRVGRPKHGKSTSSTLGRSLINAAPAQLAHDDRVARVSTCTLIGASS
jgi:hypothetical protein